MNTARTLPLALSLATAWLIAQPTAPAAPAPFPRPDRSPSRDLHRLQGEWRVVEHVLDGLRIRETQRERLVVAGARMTQYRDGEPRIEWEVALDASVTPKRITLTQVGGPGGRFFGVYSLEGDTLTLCFPVGPDRGTRPSAVGPGPDRGYEVLGRVRR